MRWYIGASSNKVDLTTAATEHRQWLLLKSSPSARWTTKWRWEFGENWLNVKFQMPNNWIIRERRGTQILVSRNSCKMMTQLAGGIRTLSAGAECKRKVLYFQPNLPKFELGDSGGFNLLSMKPCQFILDKCGILAWRDSELSSVKVKLWVQKWSSLAKVNVAWSKDGGHN